MQTHTNGRWNIKEKEDKISLRVSRRAPQKSLFQKTEAGAVGKRTEMNVCDVHRTIGIWYTDGLTSLIHILFCIMNRVSSPSHFLQLKGLDSFFVRKGQCTDVHKADTDMSHSTSSHSYRCVSFIAILSTAADTRYVPAYAGFLCD